MRKKTDCGTESGMSHQPGPSDGHVPNADDFKSRSKSRNEKRWRERDGGRGDWPPGGSSNRGGDHVVHHGNRDWNYRDRNNRDRNNRDRNNRNHRSYRDDRGPHRGGAGTGRGPDHGPSSGRFDRGARQGFSDQRRDRRDEWNDNSISQVDTIERGSSKGHDDRRNDRWTDRREDRRDERRFDSRDDGRSREWRGSHHAWERKSRPREGKEWDNRGERGAASRDLAAERPLPPLPPSPVIVAQLAELAKSQDLAYDEEKGISNVALLNSRLNIMDLRLMDKDIASWAETEEQCQRVAIKLGMFDQENNQRQPFSRDFMRRYTQEVVNAEKGVGLKENGAAILGASNPNVGIIPFDPIPDGATKVEDPRLQFANEYALLQAWVAKPLPLPAFADPTALNGAGAATDSPTHSWSRSPAKMRSEAPLKRPAADKLMIGAGDDKRPINADRSVLAHTSLQHSLHSGDSRYADTQSMELEEGYFRTKLLNGDSALLQYGEIVDLIRKGDLPDGWSAYRESDNLWISVYEAQAGDDATPMELDDRRESRDNNREDRHLHKKRKTGVIADRRKDQPPGPLREEFVRASREAQNTLGSRAFTTAGGLRVFCRRATAAHACTLSSDFSQAAKAATEDMSAYDRVMALRSSAKLLCGGPKPVEAGIRAMIKEKVVEDRGRLRDIASGALQKALRIFIQRKTQ